MTTSLTMGDSITMGIGFGTLGCCVRPDSEKERGVYILTNGHVIADQGGRINLGVKVYAGQPDNDDGVKNLVQLATVYKGLREFNHKIGYVDWALCKILPSLDVDVQNSIGGQLVRKFVDPDLVGVIKAGARTGRTTGTVDTTDDRSHIDYLPDYPSASEIKAGQGVIRFQGRNFVMRGDSGSIVVDESYRAMALVFGSDEQIHTLGLPFRRILASIKDKTKMDWEIAPNGRYKDGRIETSFPKSRVL